MVSVFEVMYNDVCEALSKSNITCGELTEKLRTAEKERDFWKEEYKKTMEILMTLQSVEDEEDYDGNVI